MLRKLLILGVFAGSSASIPIVYQSNPRIFDNLLKSAVASKPADNIQAIDLNMAVPSQPAAPQPLGRKVVLMADDRGHFAADFRLNGRQVDAMVDTGATLVAINTSTARKIGISLSQSDFSHEVNTANGSIKAAFVQIGHMQIGKIAIDDVRALVLDDKALQTNLIGMSFLTRLGKYKVENGAMLLVQ